MIMHTDTFSFGLDIKTNTATNPLGFRISFNDDILFDELISETMTTIKLDIPDNISELYYNVNLEMYGKNNSHTPPNISYKDHGSIEIINLYVEQVLLVYKDGVSRPFYENAIYKHETIEPFSTHLGKNGSILFTMTTPIYLWLLNNSANAKLISHKVFS